VTFQQRSLRITDASYFTCFSSGVSSPEVALYGVLSDFALGLFYCLGLSLHLRTIQRLQSALQQLCSKSKSTSKKTLRCGFLRLVCVPGYKNNPIVIPPALTRPGACAFKRDLRFTPPLCNYSRSPSTWDLQFSSASQLGASTRMKSFGLSSKLKKKEQ
jgi:hypothetical protein